MPISPDSSWERSSSCSKNIIATNYLFDFWFLTKRKLPSLPPLCTSELLNLRMKDQCRCSLAYSQSFLLHYTCAAAQVWPFLPVQFQSIFCIYSELPFFLSSHSVHGFKRVHFSLRFEDTVVVDVFNLQRIHDAWPLSQIDTYRNFRSDISAFDIVDFIRSVMQLEFSVLLPLPCAFYILL